jgi:hypothetical protein
MRYFEHFNSLNSKRTVLSRPSSGKGLAALKQLFHSFDGHVDVGLLAATGQIQNPIN